MVNQPRQDDDLDHGPFRDPLVNSTLVEDPLFKFLSRYWRQVGVIVAAVLITYFAAQSFKDTYTKSMERAADLFVSVQKQMDSLPGLTSAVSQARKEKADKDGDAKADQKAKEEAATKLSKAEEDLKKGEDRLKDMLTALADTRAPYNHLAITYKGLLAWRMGEVEAAKSALESAAQWQTVSIDSKERFFMEGAALALAGLLIEKPESAPQAKALLQTLAKDGNYVNVVAALRLSRLAANPEDRKAARALLEEMMLKHPEQTELLSKEISQL